MKKEHKDRIKSITIDILDAFLGIPESLVFAFDRKSFGKVLNGYYQEKMLTCANISKVLSNFKKSGYVKVVKRDGEQSIEFTGKARLAIIERVVERMKHDGQLRFISFDIPERLRANRDGFRRAIKRLGFLRVQKSLWVCDQNVGEFVELAAIEYGVTKYIAYIVSERSDIDTYLHARIKNQYSKKE